MTVPACFHCNGKFSPDEMRTAAVLCTVSFSEVDQIAVAPGGWVHEAMQRDSALRDFIGKRLGADGVFHPDTRVIEALSRVMTKTAAGLLFHEFGRIVPLRDIRFIKADHVKNVQPSAFVEIHRREDAGWAEVTRSGRELKRQAIALFGNKPPPYMRKWSEYVPVFFEYMFIRRSNNMLLAAMKLHDSLTVLLECPWPSRAGPRRKGRAPRP
jgi:hypothetical protein